MSIVNTALELVKEKVDANCKDQNITTSERILSVVAGGFILGMGLKKIFRSPFSAIPTIGLGGGLVYRGVVGHCTVKKAISDKNEVDATIIEHRYFVK